MGLSSEDIQFFCRSSKLLLCNPSRIQTSSPVWIAFLTSVMALCIRSLCLAVAPAWFPVPR